MRLITGPTTPFGRMVEVAAHEAGLPLERHVVNVYEATFLDDINPLRLIPTLDETPHGAIFDSRVICRYLESLAPAAGLYPAGTDFAFETRLALILGIMDAGVARQGERSRALELRNEAAIAVFERRIRRGLERLERTIDDFEAAWPRLDAIAAAVLLDYVDFRIGRDWRAEAPRLATWIEVAGERPSMRATCFELR